MRVLRVAGLLVALSCGFAAGTAPGLDIDFAAAREKAIVPTDGPVRLFDGTLSNFYTWLQDTKTEDPRKVFRITDGLLHVTGDGMGCVTTKQEYRDYHCVLEYKWGSRGWRGRTDRTRDSGLLIHSLGPDGAHNGTWMQSIEVQIIEGGVGDFILVGTRKPDVEPLPISLTATVGRDRDGEVIWQKDGKPETFNRKNPKRVNWYGRDPDWTDKAGFRGKNDVESPGGQWTRIDTYCDGGRIEVFVNGVKVNEGTDVFPNFGRLQFQSELAEIFVRRWELWPLGKGPKPAPAVQ